MHLLLDVTSSFLLPIAMRLVGWHVGGHLGGLPPRLRRRLRLVEHLVRKDANEITGEGQGVDLEVSNTEVTHLVE